MPSEKIDTAAGQFHKFDIELQRWPACVGSMLSTETLLAKLSTCALADLQLGSRSNHEHIFSLGAVGCYMSHASVWEHIVRHSIPMLAIFESDVLLDPQFGARFRDLVQDIQRRQSLEEQEEEEEEQEQEQEEEDASFDVGMIGYYQTNPIQWEEDRGTSALWRKMKLGSYVKGTHAYIVTLRGARKLLSCAFPIEVQVDAFLSRAIVRGVNLYCLKDKMASQEIHASLIQASQPVPPLFVFNNPLCFDMADLFGYLKSKAHKEQIAMPWDLKK